VQRTYECPVELAVEQLGAKWKPILLAHLKDAPLRYRDLRARMPRTSDKMLTQRLRELSEAGLVTRESRGYRLTDAGERLRPVLDALFAYGRELGSDRGIAFSIDQPIARPSRSDV
jgi:DNA-binding HxlR family transcriptional regulator